MKQYVLNRILFVGFALLSAPAFLFAQNEKEEKTERRERVERTGQKDKKDVQQIIITRKGDKAKTTTIEIKGNKVLINGKDASKMGDVTVNLNNLSDLRALHFDGINDDHNFNFDFNNDLNNNLNIDLNSDLNDDGVSLFSEDANRAMLGVVTDEDERGAKITSITRESGAAKAGLKVDDVITKIGDEDVSDADDVSKAVRKHKPGDKITVSFLRDGKEQKMTAELGKWKGVRINNLNAMIAPTPPTPPSAPMMADGFGKLLPYKSYSYNYGGPKLGLSVQETEDGKGVKVLQVAEEGNAAKAGLKKDDIITRINDDEVNTADEVVGIMREAINGASVKMQVLRDGKPQTIDVRIPRKLKTTDL